MHHVKICVSQNKSRKCEQHNESNEDDKSSITMILHGVAEISKNGNSKHFLLVKNVPGCQNF